MRSSVPGRRSSGSFLPIDCRWESARVATVVSTAGIVEVAGAVWVVGYDGPPTEPFDESPTVHPERNGLHGGRIAQEASCASAFTVSDEVSSHEHPGDR